MAIGRPRFEGRDTVLSLLVNFDLSVDDISAMCNISPRQVYVIAAEYNFNMAKRTKLRRLREEAAIIQKGLEEAVRLARTK